MGSIFGGGSDTTASPPPPPPLPPAAIPPTMANASVQAAGGNQTAKAAGLAKQTLKTSSQGDPLGAPKATQSLGPA